MGCKVAFVFELGSELKSEASGLFDGGASPIPAGTEIRALTGLRGVAAIYVVLFHYFPLSPNVVNPLKRVLDHGYLAVDLFFVLSGFVMALSYQHTFASGWSATAYLRFLGRRIARVYPLYLAASLVGFLFIAFGWLRYTAGAHLGWALFANVFMVQAWGIVGSLDSPAWSISAEWAAYLLFPALLIPTMFRESRWGWVSALVCVGTLAGLCALPPSVLQEYDPNHPLNFNGYSMALPLLRCIPEFTLGILAFRFARTAFGRSFASNRWVALAVCLATVMLLMLPKCDLAVVVLFPMLIVALSAGTHLPNRIFGSPPLELLGRLSYSIYLTHKLLFGLLMWIYFRGRAVGFAHASTLGAIICIALTFPIAFLAYRTIEEPGRRWLRTVFEGRPNDTIVRGGLNPTARKA